MSRDTIHNHSIIDLVSGYGGSAPVDLLAPSNLTIVGAGEFGAGASVYVVGGGVATRGTKAVPACGGGTVTCMKDGAEPLFR